MGLLTDIKQAFAKKAIEKVLREQERNTFFPDINEVKSILILFESEENEKNKSIREIISKLREQGKKVSVWGYVNKKDSETAVLRDFRLFANKEINFINLPKIALREEFLLSNYELVIDLTIKPCTPIDYLLASSLASFKVSRYKPYKGIADFMIELKEEENDEDEAFLFKQILFYLNNIQAKN